MTITEAAEKTGISYKTILRWQKSGKIPASARDWRGWRIFTEDHIQAINKILIIGHAPAGTLTPQDPQLRCS